MGYLQAPGDVDRRLPSCRRPGSQREAHDCWRRPPQNAGIRRLGGATLPEWRAHRVHRLRSGRWDCALFQSTSVAVMPYSSSAGSSGVAHLACEFGVAIVASDISDFRELSEEEGIAIDFYKSGNMQSLADRLLHLLQSPGLLEAM